MTVPDSMMRRTLLIASVALLAGCSLFRGPTPGGQRFVIFFTEFSANLDDAAQGSVKAAADWADQHKGAAVIVAGFASPAKGSPQANQELSQLRAQVVADALVSAGVAPNRIQKRARGPVQFEQMAQESRRVEIQIVTP